MAVKLATKKTLSQFFPITNMQPCGWTSSNQIVNASEGAEMFYNNADGLVIEDKENIDCYDADFLCYGGYENTDILLLEDDLKITARKTTDKRYIKIQNSTIGGSTGFTWWRSNSDYDPLCDALLCAVSGTPGQAGSAITSLNSSSGERPEYGPISAVSYTTATDHSYIIYEFNVGQQVRLQKYGELYVGFREINATWESGDTAHLKSVGPYSNQADLNQTLLIKYTDLPTSVSQSMDTYYVSPYWGYGN